MSRKESVIAETEKTGAKFVGRPGLGHSAFGTCIASSSHEIRSLDHHNLTGYAATSQITPARGRFRAMLSEINAASMSSTLN